MCAWLVQRSRFCVPCLFRLFYFFESFQIVFILLVRVKMDYTLFRVLIEFSVLPDCIWHWFILPFLFLCFPIPTSLLVHFILIGIRNAYWMSLYLKGWPALCIAAKNGDDYSCELLLERGVNAQETTPDGYTALLFAAQNGRTGTCRLLLDRGANVNCVDTNGDSALHRAALRDNLNLCKLLVSRGAEVNQKNKCGETPLFVAMDSGHTDVVLYLQRLGAQLDDKGKDTAVMFSKLVKRIRKNEQDCSPSIIIVPQ